MIRVKQGRWAEVQEVSGGAPSYPWPYVLEDVVTILHTEVHDHKQLIFYPVLASQQFIQSISE